MFRESIENWILTYLSESTEKHNNLPRCPFAKSALENNTVLFETARKAEDLWKIIENNSHEWNDSERQAVIVHLDWDIDNQERIRLCHQATTFYGMNTDKLFIEEYRVLNGTGYHFILMHDYVEMQNAKRLLKKQGYYQ